MSYIARYQISAQRTIDIDPSRELAEGHTFAEIFDPQLLDSQRLATYQSQLEQFGMELYDDKLVDGVDILPLDAYNTWCIESNIALAGDFPLIFKAYSATELANGSVTGALPSYSGARVGTEQYLDSVTWLINQDFADKDASEVLGAGYSGIITAREIQSAIWQILEQTVSGVIGVHDTTIAEALSNLARAEGDGFVADSTQFTGVVLVDDFGGTALQPQITFVQAAQLGGYVWLDANQDGIQDADEVGIQGMTVKLLRDIDKDGVLGVEEIVATTTTDATGYYEFKGLVGGVEYQVLFENQSIGLQLTNNTMDSNATQFFFGIKYYLSPVVVLAAGENRQGMNAGFYEDS